MIRICTLLAAVALCASMGSVSEAKKPKGCSRSNVRPANPSGSVLAQIPTSSAVAATRAPVRVFGNAPFATGAATIVPDITADAAPKASTSQPQPSAAAPAKRKKSKRFLFFSATTLPSSSC